MAVSSNRVPLSGLARRLVADGLLEEEANGTARFAEIAIVGVALIRGREHRPVHGCGETRDELGGTRLQGVALPGGQEILEDQETVARVGFEIERPHWTTRSRTTGFASTAPGSMRIARRTISIAASASASVAA